MKTLRSALALVPPLWPLVAGLAMVAAAWRGYTDFAIAFGVLYLAMRIDRAATKVSDTAIATGIATGPRHAGDVAGRIRAAREAMSR